MCPFSTVIMNLSSYLYPPLMMMRPMKAPFLFVIFVMTTHILITGRIIYCADCDFGTHIECAISKSRSQQEQIRSVNKPRANPVTNMKPEKEPTKIKEINQEEEAEEEEEDEDEDEEEEEGELKIPRSILIEKHPHELELLFGSPYEDKDTAFACDICNIIMDREESLYYCADCDFGSHLQYACPEADAFQTSQQSARNLYPNANSTVEMINSVTNDHERLIAAQIESQIAARARQAMLDSVGRPSGRYYYY